MPTLTKPAARKPANDFIPDDIPFDDGIPMDSPRHRNQMYLLIDSLETRWAGRKDFYCGGDMFVHFSVERARNRDFRGPDFFAVLGVDHDRERKYWASWDEGGRLPDVIVELLSDTTEVEDRTTKKDVYQNIFHTHEFFLYSPNAKDVEGFRLKSRYLPIKANEKGWLWCEKLSCWFGFWKGTFLGQTGTWLRMFEKDETLILTAGEVGAVKATSDSARADAAEAELAILKSELAKRNGHGRNGAQS